MLELIKTFHEEFKDRLCVVDDIIARNDVDCVEIPNKIAVILGMRRVGKTYLMFGKIKELQAQQVPISSILYVDFEDVSTPIEN